MAKTLAAVYIYISASQNLTNEYKQNIKNILSLLTGFLRVKSEKEVTYA